MRRLLPGILIAALWLPASISIAQNGAGGETALYADKLLTDVLTDLQARGLRIIYSSELVRPWMRVRDVPSAETPAAILREVLLPHGLEAVAGPGDSWLIVRAPPPEQTAAGAILGWVSDKQSGDPLAHVSVAILGTGTAGITAEDGQFAFSNIEPGKYSLEFRAEGYIPQREPLVEVYADSAIALDIELETPQTNLEDIIVVASKYRLLSNAIAGAQFMTREEVDRIPHLADDLFRAARRIPGIAAGDVASGLHVRGGTKDEAFLMLDGLELYEPFHLKDLGGLFGIVDSNIIDSMDIMTGGYTAEFGDRMSGVVDVNTLDINDISETSLGVSFVNAFARTQRGFDDGRGRWLLSIRRGYLDWLFDEATTGDTQFTPRYWDILSKLQYQIADNTTLTANVLFAKDDMKVVDDQGDTVGLSNGKSDSAYGWLSFATDWNENLASNTMVWMGALERERIAMVDENGNFNGQPIQLRMAMLDDRRELDFFGLHTEWSYSWNDRNIVKWGLEARHLEADYDYDLQSIFSHPFWVDEPVDESRSVVANPAGEQWSAYLALRRRISEPLLAEVGVRWDKQTYTDLDDDDQLSPRINLLYQLRPATQLRAAWGRFYQSQGINKLQVEDGVDQFFPAERADHLVLGLTHLFANGNSLRVDAYHKDYDDLRPRFENVFDPLEIIPETQVDRIMISPDSAVARGVEVLLKQNRNPVFNWWVGYAWSEVFDTIDGVDVARSWDQRHAVSTSLNWRWPKWNWNLSGIVHSGWPRTALDAVAELNPDGSLNDIDLIIGPRNEENYDDYYRLDTRLSRDVDLDNSKLNYYVEIYNLFDRENPCCVDGVGVNVGPGGSTQTFLQLDSGMTRLYSFGVTWTF